MTTTVAARTFKKLTAADIEVLRQRWIAGARQADLAKEYGVSQKTISRAVRRT